MSIGKIPSKMQNGDLKSPRLFNRLKEEDIKYQRSFFAFIDILGFKEIVKEKRELAPQFLYNILFEQEFHGELYKDVRLKFLSDSILIWSEGTDPLDFWNLVNIVDLVKLAFFKKGILVRGGVSFGENFINEDFIISPALIKSYEIEQRAIYPRIIIDREALKLTGQERFLLDGFNQPYLKIGNFTKRVYPEKLVSDFDGEIILDNFPDRSGTFYIKTGRSPIAVPEDAPLSQEQIQAFRKQAQEEIEDYQKILQGKYHKDLKPNVRQKIQYLISSFNSWLDSHSGQFESYKIPLENV